LVSQGAATASKGMQIAPAYDPGILQPATTYYWRVDETARRGAAIPGSVWSFTTRADPQALVYHVSKQGSDDHDGLSREKAFATIRKGIDSAADGDTILVHPGIYREPVNFMGKAVTVRSAEQPAVLRAGADFAVSFHMSEGPASILENFIIRDSFLGIFIVESSPTIRNVTVVQNRHGVEAYAGAAPDIVNCIFWHNTADDLFGCQARFSCIERGGEGTGNLSRDPLFVDPGENDFHLRSEHGRHWPEHDVWVLDDVTSPCIDAGDPQSVYSREPNPNGGRINLGAYGGTAYASRTGNFPPIVIITAPAPDATLYASWISLEARAWDVDGFVVKVEFFANDTKVGEDTDGSDGWAIVWGNLAPDPVITGDVEISARAVDDDGAAGTDSLPVSLSTHHSRPR